MVDTVEGAGWPDRDGDQVDLPGFVFHPDLLGNLRQGSGDAAQLTQWLRCRLGLPVDQVIGHNESLSSPFYVELDPRFRGQTHSDWNHADMQRYRALLARYPC